ncbi:hypothetical protein GE253_09155 [Niveispirillum sp. SYP-B3756]|uniref:TIR domain-containing protein n=1 Tax=Niveispirillum sp. SYP-B3756 TaxID=2662178 RepID=UPI001291CA6B|nr:TIR domain-containing protein [Niveispirillum sp. SYP-B3756]MQP65518.1 hypothetical protein [Niveispirillum sp. SYP-B3756]
MTIHEDLFEVVRQLEFQVSVGGSPRVKAPLSALKESASKVAKSFSGSWLGYHSRIYYENLVPTPAGANFSAEWGAKDMSFTELGSTGDWVEYQYDFIINYIKQCSGNPNLDEIQSLAKDAIRSFEESIYRIASILESELDIAPDTFLSRLKGDLDSIEIFSVNDIIKRMMPKGSTMTRDYLAASQGHLTPPHIEIIAIVSRIEYIFSACKNISDIARRAASHLERKHNRNISSKREGTNVFIGHGRSMLWRELKDFIKDRVGLPWDEFNRVPVAGVTNISRLIQMLDSASIAFLIMTAEDEMSDGKNHARMNVIHEAGLFQGRLGFTRSIILLEEGCEEFSNIQGLGQIRFPKGNISASFEEVRLVLEREGLI